MPVTFREELPLAIRTVNPLEQLNHEIRRRTWVVGVVPERISINRLIGTLLIITDEDWRAGRTYIGKAGVKKVYKRFLERNTKEFILEESLITWKHETQFTPIDKTLTKLNQLQYLKY